MPTQRQYSAVWSSLFILESANRYIPASKLREHPQTKKRHETLANAVALIGASSSNSKTDTACTIEILSLNATHPAITLRLAQNQVVSMADKEDLQDLVDILVQNVLECDERIWRDGDGALYFHTSFDAQ